MFSLGLGWGYLGSHDDVSNPFSVLLGSKWDTRPGNTTSTGGTANLSSMFKGKTAFFGGVQYTASDKLLFKAELEGNTYQANHETITNRSPAGLTLGRLPPIPVG